MSVKSVQFAVATHIMAALGIYPVIYDEDGKTVEVPLQTLQGGLGCDHTRKKWSKCACASCPTDHAARCIPCQRSTTGICHSFVPGGKEVSGQLPPQGMHVSGAFSSSEEF